MWEEGSRSDACRPLPHHAGSGPGNFFFVYRGGIPWQVDRKRPGVDSFCMQPQMPVDSRIG